MRMFDIIKDKRDKKELTKEQINDIIASCGHESTIRGERLDIAQFVELSDKIGEALNA